MIRGSTFALIVLMVALTGCGRTPLDSDKINQSPSTQAIAAPSDLVADGISDSTIELVWTNPNIIEDCWIRIEYKKASDSEYTYTNLNYGTQSYSLGNLESGTSYDFRLQTIVGSGDKSQYSNIASAQTLRSVIINPDAIALTSPGLPMVSRGELPVSWTYSSSAQNVASFEVLFKVLNISGSVINSGTFQIVPFVANDGSYETSRTLAGTGCEDNDLADKITFQVRAVPKDFNLHNYSAWVMAMGSITCLNTK